MLHNDPDRWEELQVQPTKTGVAQQIAQAASDFEKLRTGQYSKAVTVVMSEKTLVITLHGALCKAEQDLARSPDGVAKVKDYHRQLFESSSEVLRREFKRMAGVDALETTGEAEPETGTVVAVFSSQTTVQMYQLSHAIAAETGSEKVSRP